MSEQLDFETTLERRLRARAAAGSRPFDAVAIARAAIAARPPRRLGLTARTGRRAWALALAGLLLALLAGVLLAGALLQHREPWLAVARADGIYLAHQDGSLVRRLADTGSSPRLSWSADGALLLVEDVLLVREVTGDRLFSRMTAFRPDGSIAWTTDYDSAAPPYGVVLEAGAAWSHRGHRIAWIDASGFFTDMVVTDVDSGQSVRLGKHPGTDYIPRVSPDWSPDDSRIVVEGEFASEPGMGDEGPVLLVVPAEGGEPMTLPQRVSGWGSTAWSPDGRSIATTKQCLISLPNCVAPTGIALIDAATGTLVDALPADGLLLEWSPDGNLLKWDGAEGVMVSGLPLSAGRAVDVMPGGYGSGWTPDGALLVLKWKASSASGSSDPDAPDLWRVEADGSHPVLLARGVTAAALQPTP